MGGMAFPAGRDPADVEAVLQRLEIRRADGDRETATQVNYRDRAFSGLQELTFVAWAERARVCGGAHGHTRGDGEANTLPLAAW